MTPMEADHHYLATQGEALRADIRAYLESRTAKKDSVSAVVEHLRQPMPGGRCYGKHPKFPTNHSKAMDFFEKLGFKVVDGKRKYTWDVAI